MDTYVPSTQQLVLELFVRDIRRSEAFYRGLGFAVIEDKGTFIALTWEGHQLFLDERSDLPEPPTLPRANVRIMVARVDEYWSRARQLGATVFAPIADRDYGLRDFTVLDPDGFGVRFGSLLGRDHA